MTYEDLHDEQLMILANILTDESTFTWIVSQLSSGNGTRLKHGSKEVFFSYDTGQVYYYKEGDTRALYNIWKFINTCKRFGLSY